MFDESDKVNAYVKQKNIGMKIDYSGKARQVLKNRAPQDAGTTDDEPQAEELDGASRAMRRIIRLARMSLSSMVSGALKPFSDGLTASCTAGFAAGALKFCFFRSRRRCAARSSTRKTEGSL